MNLNLLLFTIRNVGENLDGRFADIKKIFNNQSEADKRKAKRYEFI